jgi:S1-C subfamily serine protease
VDVHSAPESFSKLANRMMPAVVSITTSQTVATGLPRFDSDNPLGQFNPFFNQLTKSRQSFQMAQRAAPL